MNAPTEAGAAQAATRGGTPRGRGRGGSRGNGRTNVTSRAVAKPQTGKIGPSRLLEVDWTKDSVLKDNCFVIWLGTGQAGDQQWTIHRPIGETPLKPTEWVATPSRDIHFLLLRRESEGLAAWKRQADLAKRQEVLGLQRGRKLSDDGHTEVWTFDGAPAIQPTIRTCMAAAKAAGAKESEWLSYADPAVRGAEQTFKDTLKSQSVPSAWLEANPKPAHETRGGPLGDVPQRAISHLSGCSLSAAKDRCLMAAIGLTPPATGDDNPGETLSDSEESDEEDAEETAKEQSSAASQSGKSGTGGRTPAEIKSQPGSKPANLKVTGASKSSSPKK